MPYEIDHNGVRIIGVDVPIRFYDDSRVLRAEIFLQSDNTLNFGGISGAGGDTSGSTNAHGLNDTSIHTGTLDDNQAPQFLKHDGSRAMTGNLVMGGNAITNVGTFTEALKINANSATAFVIEQDGVHDDVFIVDTANRRVGIGGVPIAGRLLDLYSSTYLILAGTTSADDQYAELSTINDIDHRLLARTYSSLGGGTRDGISENDSAALFGQNVDRMFIGSATAAAIPIYFGTADSTWATLAANSNVGIGTDPEHKLVVEESGNAITGTSVDVSELAGVFRYTSDTPGATGIGFGRSVNKGNIGAAIIHERKGSQSWGHLHFATKPSPGAAASNIPIQMTIFDAGNITMGGALANNAQLTVDQSSASGAEPVIYLDQGDISEPILYLTSDDADADLVLVKLGVTGDPQWKWIEASDKFSFTHGLMMDGDLEFQGAQSITTTADNLTLTPDGDLILDPAGNDILPATGYDLNIGALSNKYLTLHVAELWVETLVAQDTIATIGGRILVGPTTVLTEDLGSGAGDTTITVKHNQMASGDRIVMQANGKLEWMAIASAAGGAGPYTYTVTRDLDTSGRNLWYAGDAVFNTGTTGDGFIDLYSVAGITAGSTAGPTIVGNVRNSATFSDYTEAWAIGNLNGLYGYGSDTYGVGLGKYSAADYVTIDPTNGVRFLDSGDVVRAQLTGTTWTLGSTATEHINLTTTAVQIKDGGTVYTELAAGALSLGDTANEHVLVNSSGMSIKDGVTVVATYATAGIELFANSIKVVDIDGSNGDFIFGQVATDKSNLFWDQSEGQLNFRGSTDGTVVQAYVDTDGSITAGAGAMLINASGISLDFGDSTETRIKWPGGTAGASTPYMATTAYSSVDHILIIADGFIFDEGTGANKSGFNIWAGLNVGSSASGAIDGDIQVYTDARIGGGLYVGATGTDPDADWIYADGGMYINDTANAKQTIGLTINQGANDNEILALKSSDVAHGITDFAETDTFGAFSKHSADAGGLQVSGYRDADSGAYAALALIGRLGEAADTTKSTGGYGVVHIDASVKSGTDIAAVGTDGNLLSIATNATTRFLFDAEGSAHADVEWIAFDGYNDLALLTDLESAMLAERDPLKAGFVDFLQYNHATLEDAGLVHFDRDAPGHAMVNTTRLSMLLVGALQQLGGRMDAMEQRQLALEIAG